jgi:hypothetical protein
MRKLGFRQGMLAALTACADGSSDKSAKTRLDRKGLVAAVQERFGLHGMPTKMGFAATDALFTSNQIPTLQGRIAALQCFVSWAKCGKDHCLRLLGDVVQYCEQNITVLETMLCHARETV